MRATPSRDIDTDSDMYVAIPGGIGVSLSLSLSAVAVSSTAFFFRGMAQMLPPAEQQKRWGNSHEVR